MIFIWRHQNDRDYELRLKEHFKKILFFHQKIIEYENDYFWIIWRFYSNALSFFKLFRLLCFDGQWSGIFWVCITLFFARFVRVFGRSKCSCRIWNWMSFENRWEKLSILLLSNFWTLFNFDFIFAIASGW